ncbi:hypothetical protein AAFH68_37330 [Flavobacterium sp. CGRL1]
MDNNNQIVNKKIKEVFREYKALGYNVIINPSKNEVPDFLDNFIPDIIAHKQGDNVIIEVKISSSLNTDGFKKLENIANLIDSQKEWRFELIFTNPREYDDTTNNNLLNNQEINNRISLSIDLINKDLNIAFLSLWTVFESISRKAIKPDVNLNKTVNSLIKTLYSRSNINHSDYKKLEYYFKLRNNITHGFTEIISLTFFNELLEIILKIEGKSKYSFIYNWIKNQDLENYIEVYSLYNSVEHSYSNQGLFKINVVNDKLIISSYNDDILEINLDDQKRALLEFLSEEFMNGMDAETYYSLNRELEKDN